MNQREGQITGATTVTERAMRDQRGGLLVEVEGGLGLPHRAPEPRDEHDCSQKRPPEKTAVSLSRDFGGRIVSSASPSKRPPK